LRNIRPIAHSAFAIARHRSATWADAIHFGSTPASENSPWRKTPAGRPKLPVLFAQACRHAMTHPAAIHAGWAGGHRADLAAAACYVARWRGKGG